jgi:hypothetical protein
MAIEKSSRVLHMNININGKFIFYHDNEIKIVWSISRIKENDMSSLNNFEKKSFLEIRDFLFKKYPELLL